MTMATTATTISSAYPGPPNGLVFTTMVTAVSSDRYALSTAVSRIVCGPSSRLLRVWIVLAPTLIHGPPYAYVVVIDAGDCDDRRRFGQKTASQESCDMTSRDRNGLSLSIDGLK